MKCNSFKTVLVLLLLLCSMMAKAANGDKMKVGGISYRIISERERTVEVLTIDSDKSEVVIPATVSQYYRTYSVIGIIEEAFKNKVNLRSITINASVTSIGTGVFYGCTGLASITIPNSVTSIGQNAFGNCTSLRNLCIEDGDSKLSLNGCLCIGCQLDSLYLGREVLDVSLFFRRAEAYWGDTKSVTIGSKVTSICDWLFAFCTSLEKVEIQGDVTSIGENAFYNCTSLETFEIPDCVTVLGQEAFEFCANLESIKIGTGITKLPRCVFAGCKKLKSVVIPESVEMLEYGVFLHCHSLESVTIPSGIKRIYNDAFRYNYNLQEIVSHIPGDRLFTVWDFVFDYVDKEQCTLYVPENSKNIYSLTKGWSAFSNIVEKQLDTKVEQVLPVEDAQGLYYDLYGRKIAAPTKGIYIVNGKKIFVK